MASYRKMSPMLAILCMLIATSPAGGYAALVAPAAADQRGADVEIKPEQLDKGILKKLDRLFQELAGSAETKMSWTSVSLGPDGLYFLSDAEGNQAQVTGQAGEVSMAILHMKAEQVGEAFRSAAAQAVKELDPAQNVTFNHAQRTCRTGRKVVTSLGGNAYSVTFDGGDVSSINLTYSYANMPQAVKAGTQRLLRVLGNQTFCVEKAVMYSAQNKLEWRLEARNNSTKKRVLISINASFS